jgi:hypothetical protein
MQPAEPSVSRRSRTGLIVGIVVVALVLIGGGTTALMLINRPAPQAQVPKRGPDGHYQTLMTCASLTAPPFTFEPNNDSFTHDGATDRVCSGTFGAHRVSVAMIVFSGPTGEAKAVAASVPYQSTYQYMQRLNGTGFENAPLVGFIGDEGPMCEAAYRRSNLKVEIDFPNLPGGTDTASCTSAIMPYVRKLYAEIG